MSKLQLTRPIVALDCETTGVDVSSDRIIELATCKINTDWSREVKCYRYYPEMPIPPSATEIHGISDSDVRDKPKFAQHAKSILAYISGCDLLGFHSNAFDFPLLFNEFARSGIYWNYKEHNLIDNSQIFRIQEPRTLSAAVKFYCGREHEEAHSAQADIENTCDVFEAQLDCYSELPDTVDKLALFCNYDRPLLDLSGRFTTNKDGEIILNFGKNKGKLAKENMDYLRWMLSAEFPADTRQIILELLEKQHNQTVDTGVI